MDSKVCTDCGLPKPLKDFGRNRSSRDGVHGICSECSIIRSKAFRQRQKLGILRAYSGAKVECACCREDEIAFLTVDHVGGGGNKHRRDENLHGTRFYNWLVKHNYPPGFRVLCFNCNCAVAMYGQCPHVAPINQVDAFKLKGKARGENNGASKLNWDIVNSIRSDLQVMGVAKISKKYSINPMTVKKIRDGVTWRSV